MKLRSIVSLLGFVALQNTAGCYVEWGREPTPIPAPPPSFPDDVDDAPPTFTFSRSRGCASVLNRTVCGVDRPLMVGVQEAIRLTIPGNERGPDPEITSSDPETLELSSVTRVSGQGERYSGVIAVRGLRTGASTLSVRGNDGRQWTFDIRVDEAVGMFIEGDEGNPRFDDTEGLLRLRVGERVSLTGYPVNLNVERLYANDGVVWTAPHTRVVNLSWQSMSGARVVDDHVYIEGRAEGTVTLQVRAGVVERTVRVEVGD